MNANLQPHCAMSFTVALRHSKTDCTDNNCDCKTQNFRVSIFTAAQTGDLATIKRRICSGSNGGDNIINKTDGAGYTMLHLAAQGNHFNLVAYLLSKGAGPDGATSSQCTPLHRASFSGSFDSVRLLVQAGANVNAIDTSFGDGRTPLHKAAEQKHMDIYSLLLNAGADPIVKDNYGFTAMKLLTIENDYCNNNAKNIESMGNNDDAICQVIGPSTDIKEVDIGVDGKGSADAAIDGIGDKREDLRQEFGINGKMCEACEKISYMFARVRGKLVCVDCKSSVKTISSFVS